MGYRVGLTYNIKSDYILGPDDPPDANAEFDHESTIVVIEGALRAAGHDAVRIGGARQVLERLELVKSLDIVFNIAEGFEGRNRESQVPILLEMLRIPFVGADGLTLGLTLDKVLTKKVLIAEGIPTPRYAEIHDPGRLPDITLTYPLIVKLRCEGSSKGLSERSLVTTADELAQQVQWLAKTYPGSSIFLEEFIEGSEFTVALIGNDSPQAYSVCQILLDGQRELGRKFFTFAYLRSGSDYLCPAPIPESLARQMQELALRTYRAVDCRDFGRVDFRVDRQGRPYVLEINPLPSLSTEDVFMYVAKHEGIPYAAMLNQIFTIALARYDMPVTSSNGLASTDGAKRQPDHAEGRLSSARPSPSPTT